MGLEVSSGVTDPTDHLDRYSASVGAMSAMLCNVMQCYAKLCNVMQLVSKQDLHKRWIRRFTECYSSAPLCN